MIINTLNFLVKVIWFAIYILLKTSRILDTQTRVKHLNTVTIYIVKRTNEGYSSFFKIILTNIFGQSHIIKRRTCINRISACTHTRQSQYETMKWSNTASLILSMFNIMKLNRLNVILCCSCRFSFGCISKETFWRFRPFAIWRQYYLVIVS